MKCLAVNGVDFCFYCQQALPADGDRECQIGEPPMVPAEDVRQLFGDRLEAIIAAIGIPPCGGCKERRDWLNRAHAWLREKSWC